MFLQFQLAIRDIQKNMGMVILFSLQMLILFIILTFLISQLPSLKSVGKALSITNKEEIVYFNYYQNNWTDFYFDRNMFLFFKSLLDDRGVAYSMMKSTGLDNMNRTHQDIVDVILIVGNFDRRSFVDQTKSYPRDQSAVLIGSKVRSLNVGDTVELGLNNKKQYRVTGRLMEGEGYLEKRWYRSLDDSLVVFTTFKEAVALYEMAAIYDFIPNIHLIHPSEGLISQVQEMANKTKKLTLIPETRGVKKVLEGYFLQNIITIISYFLFVFSVAFFTISAFIAMLRFTISKNEVEYLTHQIYGATLWRLRIRITSFISMIVFVPFVVFLFLFRPIILKFEGGAMILWGNLLAAVFIILFASFFAVQKLKEKDILTMIRRD